MIPSKLELGRQIISQLISSVEKIKETVALIVVSNVKGITSNHSDYEKYSVCTEFFSENEMEEIVSCFRQFGIYTKIYFDENEFIRATLEGEHKIFGKRNIIVYNSSQKGTGPGRKSLLPAFCNLNKLNIIGSNAYVVSLCRHKYHYNQILSQLGLPVVKSWLFDAKLGWLQNKPPNIGTKIIIKPTYESASIGIDNSSVTFYDDKIEDYLCSKSREYGQPLTIQEFIEGYEIEIPVINCLTPLCIMPIGISIDSKKKVMTDILTYERVYYDEYSFYNFEEFPEKLELEILEVAENAAKCLGIEGFGRVDFRITSDLKIYITDVSTNPHITKHSSFSFLFTQIGFNYKDLPIALIGTAI